MIPRLPTYVALLVSMAFSGALPAEQPEAPAKKPADTITIPADYTKGEKAEYQVTIKVTQHTSKGDKPDQVTFPVTVEALEADKDHVILSWTARPPATTAIPVGLRNEAGEELILLNGFAPRMSVNAADGVASLQNFAEAKAAVPRIIEGLLSLEKRAGLKDDETGPLKKVIQETLDDDAEVESIPDKLTQLWYTPMYVSGPSGRGKAEAFETELGPGITAKGTRTTTYARTSSGGAKMVIDGAVGGKALPDLVVQMLQQSGVKLSEADISRIQADKSQQVRSTSEYITDKRGWLVRAKTLVSKRLAGSGKTVETTAELKGEVKSPAK